MKGHGHSYCYINCEVCEIQSESESCLEEHSKDNTEQEIIMCKVWGMVTNQSPPTMTWRGLSQPTP